MEKLQHKIMFEYIQRVKTYIFIFPEHNVYLFMSKMLPPTSPHSPIAKLRHVFKSPLLFRAFSINFLFSISACDSISVKENEGIFPFKFVLVVSHLFQISILILYPRDRRIH